MYYINKFDVALEISGQHFYVYSTESGELLSTPIERQMSNLSDINVGQTGLNHTDFSDKTC